jgi:hypothetical protein
LPILGQFFVISECWFLVFWLWEHFWDEKQSAFGI